MRSIGRSGAGAGGAASRPAARQAATSAYSTPCEPDQRAGGGERLLVDDVDRHDAAPRVAEARGSAAGLELEEVDQRQRQVGLPREMAQHVGLVHRRHRVRPHGRVAVEPVDRTVAGPREQRPECLPAADLRRADDKRRGGSRG
jgi:hypothetical protein